MTCSFSSAWVSMNDACDGRLALKSKLGSLRLLRIEDTSHPADDRAWTWSLGVWAFLRALPRQTAPKSARRCL